MDDTTDNEEPETVEDDRNDYGDDTIAAANGEKGRFLHSYQNLATLGAPAYPPPTISPSNKRTSKKMKFIIDCGRPQCHNYRERGDA